MSNPLEEESEFTRIIDGILSTADLQTVTRKKIRQGLEATLGRDLNDQKHAVRNLIEARFDAIHTADAQTIPTPPPISTTDISPKLEANGHTPSDDTDLNGDADSAILPASKKQKRESSTEDADAQLAAKLQAEENRMAQGRTTRGGSGNKPTKKSRPKKSAKKRSRDADDSEADGSEGKRKAGGGFQKPFTLSYSLADLCGESQLSRPQVVKKLWEHIKANDLQDPKDKRQIRCDEKMQAVFKTSRVDMFQMNKLLGNQLYPIEDE